MSQPTTKARLSSKKLRHRAKLEKRRLQRSRMQSLATIQGGSLGAKHMEEINKVPETTSVEAAPENITEEQNLQAAEEIIEGDEILDGTEEHVELESSTATEAPVMSEPGSEPAVQAAPAEDQQEIKEPTELNG